MLLDDHHQYIFEKTIKRERERDPVVFSLSCVINRPRTIHSNLFTHTIYQFSFFFICHESNEL